MNVVVLRTAYGCHAAGILIFLLAILLAHPECSAQTDNTLQSPDVTANPDLIPFRDFDVIEFNKPLAELRNKYKFGIFREQVPRTTQWIEERLTKITRPGFQHPFTFLQLHYEVPTSECYNGWWLKLEGADWTAFRLWNLVLRLREGEMCTDEFKVELKCIEKGEKSPTTYAGIVNLSPTQHQRLDVKGFVDFTIPMRLLVGEADLSHMHEFVIVFENTRVTAEKGDLLVHSVRLSPPRDDDGEIDIEMLLDRLARRAFLWFEDHRDEKTGLILDRSPNSPGQHGSPQVASIASVGYFLSMLPEAIRTGQIGRVEAEKQASQVLSFVLNQMPHHEGMLYHFVNRSTGVAEEGSEVGCLDSAIFFNGCIVVAEEFDGPVRKMGNSLVDRATWSAFVVKHPTTGKELLSLGWKPTIGFLGPMDVRSSETAMAYFLAIGSRTHPISPRCWYNTSRNFKKIEGRRVLNPTLPLFTSYYGLAWHQLVGLVDKDGVDLEANAREASLVNRDFCRLPQQSYSTYSINQGGWWGISAGDSPRGYIAPGLTFGASNGTVWPLAALAAEPWVANEIKADLNNWRKSSIWPIVSGPYGLGPFNLDKQWIGKDIIGIDLGSFYINHANRRNGTVQNLWMKHPVARSALERLGFQRNP